MLAPLPSSPKLQVAGELRALLWCYEGCPRLFDEPVMDEREAYDDR